MTDFYGNKFQIGDECVRYSGWTSSLEKVTVLEIEREDKILIINSFGKEVYTSDKKLIDITAMKRKLYCEIITNSVKALGIKGDDILAVSLVPNSNKALVTIRLEEINIKNGDSNV